MDSPRRFPIFVEDQNIFDALSKKIGSYAAAAAGLPEGFSPLFRHADEFCAKSFGSTSRQRLFAEVKSTPPKIKAGLSRAEIELQCQAGLQRGAAALMEEGLITPSQASAITSAAPEIVRAVAKDLQYLAADRFTFERTVLDARLLAARAPKFEYAITSDSRVYFDFEMAREALRAVAGESSREAVEKVSEDEVVKILRASLVMLDEATKQRKLPVTHTPIVLCDGAGYVVGVSFQHPVHLGVVPVCCEDVDRFWAVVAALHTGTPAQSTRGSEWAFDHTRPFSIHPYSPPGRGFQYSDDDGEAVYYAPVTVERALAYLAELARSFNDNRVKCDTPNLHLLKSASLESLDIYHGVSGKKKRTFWYLRSSQSKPGLSKLMSAAGTSGGIAQNGVWLPQWYLRQTYWLTEEDVPGLDTSPSHFLAPRSDDDMTRIVPDSVESFTKRALEQINKMPKEQKATDATQAAFLKLQQQKKLLQKVKACIELEAQARKVAIDAGLSAVGPEVLPPP